MNYYHRGPEVLPVCSLTSESLTILKFASLSSLFSSGSSDTYKSKTDLKSFLVTNRKPLFMAHYSVQILQFYKGVYRELIT